jgi:two-component system chemotaxis response regulator CheY
MFRKRILVADDEPSVREAIKLLLSVDQHTVTEAGDGVEAFDLVTRHPFDLVITDYEMPRMKGNELAVKIKAGSPSQPIIMITAYPEKLGNAKNPVDAILNKPFQFEDLRRAITKLLS